MDTILHIPTSMAKRPCPFSSSSCSIQNPNKLSTGNGGNRNQLDQLLESFLSMADSPAFQLSLDCAFDRILADESVHGGDADQSRLIDRMIDLGSLFLKSAHRAARMLASFHNSLSWPLPPDLTIKVFSMLDTQSLCYAATTCSMFRKYSMDPLCYSDIDLRTVVPKVNNAVVSTMIQRAGDALQSLKLGIVPGRTASAPSCHSLVHVIRNATSLSNVSWNDKRTRKGKESSVLTRTCLNPLSSGNGATGVLLRRLHLYNIELMDNKSLCGALAACPYLLDLKIVGLNVELKHVIESVSRNCHSIERLFFESSKTGRDDSLKSSACVDFVNNCPSLTSLALRGFKLHDFKVRLLVKSYLERRDSDEKECQGVQSELDVLKISLHCIIELGSYSMIAASAFKGFRKLKYVDFSTSYSITGQFLRNLGNNNGGGLLEFLLLRDCMHLREVEAARFLTSILAGDFQSIRHIDISNKEGLASECDWYRRCYRPNLPLKKLIEERPGISLLADFPSGLSFFDLEQVVDSDIELLSELSNHSSDTSTSWSSSSVSSYASDQGRADDAAIQDSGLVVYEESSVEVDLLLG